MLALFLLTLAFMAAPQVANATTGTVIPPTNPGENQYVEDLPTAGGPTAAGPTAARAHPGAVDAPGSTAGGPSNRIASSTVAKLARLGAVGNRAASLAQAAAPPRTVERGTNRRSTHHRELGAANGSDAGSSGGASPVATVARSMFGSQGSLGLWLPFAIIVSTLGAGVIAFRRRRAS